METILLIFLAHIFKKNHQAFADKNPMVRRSLAQLIAFYFIVFCSIDRLSLGCIIPHHQLEYLRIFQLA